MSNRKRQLRILLCLCLCFTVACWGACPAWAASLSQLREEQEQLQRQKEENDLKLEELRRETDRKKEYQNAIDEQIGTVQKELDLLRKKIDGLNRQIALSEAEVKEKREDIRKNRDLLKERLRAVYVTGEASVLAMVLDSTDLLDLSGKMQFLSAITRHDSQLLEELSAQLEDIQSGLEKIKNDKDELSKSKKELDAKHEELSALYEEARQAAETAESAQRDAEHASEQLGDRLAENEAAIAKLEEELRGQYVSGGYAGTGSFLWPMPGYTYLTCLFGEGGHRGVDIAGSGIYGKPIVAADGGTVIYAGWNDSYGYCVFIDHGNGYETRYAHMCELGSTSGARVEQGQVIGYAGSTGNSTGPHLHFEVLYRGGLTDPMGYF